MLLCQYAAGKLSFPTGRLEGSDGAVEMVNMNPIYFSPSAMIIRECLKEARLCVIPAIRGKTKRKPIDALIS